MLLTVILTIVSIAGSALTFYWAIYPSRGWSWIWFPIIQAFVVFWFLFLAMVLLFGLWSERYRHNDKEYMPPKRFPQWVLGQWCVILLIFFRVHNHVSGMGKLPDRKKFMLVSNHLSAFDHICLLARFRHHEVVCVSKKENFAIPVEGGWTKYCGFIPMDRGDVNKGIEMIKLASSYIEKDICSVMIAPEGTRNREFPKTKLLPFHSGSFEMARMAKCPIVVTAIQNTNAVTKRFPLRATHVYIDIVGVLEYEEYENLTNAEVAERCRQLILHRFEEKDARFYHLKEEVVDTEK